MGFSRCVLTIEIFEQDYTKNLVPLIHDQSFNRSLCGSPIIIVPKKDGSWWMRMDYRDMKNTKIKNKYPLLMINDLWDQL